MTRSKIIYENREDKKTIVIIQNKFGKFKGVAVVADEDLMFDSLTSGYRIAEAKAYSEYYKYRSKIARDKYNNYMQLYNTVMVHEDTKSPIAKKMRKAIHLINAEADYWNKKSHDVYNSTLKKIEEKNETMEKFRQWQNGKGELHNKIKKLLEEKANEVKND